MEIRLAAIVQMFSGNYTTDAMRWFRFGVFETYGDFITHFCKPEEAGSKLNDVRRSESRYTGTKMEYASITNERKGS